MFRSLIYTARALGIALALVFISACASKPAMPERVAKADLSAGAGFMVGSFSRLPEKPYYNAYSFLFRNIETGEVESIRVTPNSMGFGLKFENDFETAESHGALFGFVLPAGKYEFYNYSLYLNGGMFEKSWFSKEDFSIPVTIGAGEIVYIGEIKFIPEWGKNVFGFQIHGGGSWQWNNHQDRDVGLLKKKFPELNWQQLRTAVPFEEAKGELETLDSET